MKKRSTSLNAYQKKSKRGSQEPQEHVETTKVRLKWAEAEHAAYLERKAAEERAKKVQPPFLTVGKK